MLRCVVREEKGEEGKKGGEYLRIEEVNGREDDAVNDRKDDVRLVADVLEGDGCDHHYHLMLPV